MVKLIVAVGPNNLIGARQGLAWHVPAELAFFKKMTMGHAVLFGGKTYRNLPRKLVGRKIYVLTSQVVDGAEQVKDTAAALSLIKRYQEDSNQTLWIAGGKQVFEQFYRYASELVVSQVHVLAKGDVYLDWDLSTYERYELQSNSEFSVFVYDSKINVN